MPRGDRARSRSGRAGRVIAVGGGKGGVGKSVVSANLAVALGRLGYQVTLVDADLGAANLHTLFGVTRPGPGLGAFLDHEVEQLGDAAEPCVAPNVRLVAGTSRPGAANLMHSQKLRLLRGIARLGGDAVVVDVGAGIAFNTIDLVAAADVKLLVATAELTSLSNAYAFLKACVHRVVRKLPADDAGRAAVDAALAGHESQPIRDLVETMRDAGEPLAEALIETLVRFGVGLVGNQVGGGHDGVVMQRISRMISDYLLVHAPVLAMVPRSDAVRASVAARRPLVLGDDGGEAAAQLRGLARAVMEVELPGRGGRAPAPTVPLWIERDGEPDRDAAAAPAR